MNDLYPEYIFKDSQTSNKYANEQMEPNCVKTTTTKNLNNKEQNNPILKLAKGLKGHFFKDRQTADTQRNSFNTTNIREMPLQALCQL